MLTAEDCAARRARLWAALPAECDALLIAEPAHLIYLAGFAPSPFDFRANEAGALLILEPGRATLVADDLLAPAIEQAHVDRAVAPTWYDGRRSAPHRRGLWVKTAVAELSSFVGSRVGYEPASLPIGIVEGRSRDQWVDLSPILRELRRSKDADEVALIRRSLVAAEAGMAAARAEVRPGMTEREVYRRVQSAAIEAAGEPVVVYGDFVSGPRCERGGGPPSSRVIEAGDLLLLDFSVVIHGYRGDVAATFAVGRPPTPDQRDRHAACLDALDAGVTALGPGVPAAVVDRAVRGSFAAQGLDRFFPGHSGHGIGLGHPEPPFLVPESADTLREGDVVAIEPGQYEAGVVGMRFERNYRITAGVAETLSRHSLAIGQAGECVEDLRVAAQ